MRIRYFQDFRSFWFCLLLFLLTPIPAEAFELKWSARYDEDLLSGFTFNTGGQLRLVGGTLKTFDVMDGSSSGSALAGISGLKSVSDDGLKMVRLASNRKFGAEARFRFVVSEIGESEPLFETDYLNLGALPETRSSRNGRFHLVLPDASVSSPEDRPAYHFDIETGKVTRFELPSGAAPLSVTDSGEAYIQTVAGLAKVSSGGALNFFGKAPDPEEVSGWAYVPVWILSVDESRLAVSMTDPATFEDVIRVYGLATGGIIENLAVPLQGGQRVGAAGFTENGIRVAVVDYSQETSERVLVFDLQENLDPDLLWDFTSSTRYARPVLSIDGDQLAIVKSDGVVDLLVRGAGAVDAISETKVPLPKLVAGLGGLEVLTDIALSPDNSLLATADYTGQLWLWDLETGRAIREFGTYNNARIAFTDDGKRLEVLGDSDLFVFDLNTGKVLKRYDFGGYPTLLFRPLGEELGYLICHIRGCIIQPASEELLRINLEVPLNVKKAALCGSALFLVSEEETGLVLQIANLDSAQPEQTRVVHSRQLDVSDVNVLSCGPERTGVIGTEDGQLLHFVEDGELAKRTTLGSREIQAIEYLSDNVLLVGQKGEARAAADDPAKLLAVDARTLQPMLSVPVPLDETGAGSHIYHMRVADDLSRVVTVMHTGRTEPPNQISVLDLEALIANKGTVAEAVSLESEKFLLHADIAAGGRKPQGITFSPDSKKLSVTYNEQSAVWNLQTGQISRFQDHGLGDGLKFGDAGYFFAERGEGVAYVGDDHSVSKSPLPPTDGPSSFLMTGGNLLLAGDTLALSANEGTVIWSKGRLQDQPTSSYLLPAPGTYPLHWRSLDPNGNRLLIQTTDGIRVQDIHNRENPLLWEVSELPDGLEIASTQNVAFTPDGRHVIVQLNELWGEYNLAALDAETGELVHKWQKGHIDGPKTKPVRVTHPGDGPELLALLRTDGLGFAELLMTPDEQDPPRVDLLGLDPFSASASPDGRFLTVIDNSERVLLWDRETGRSQMLDAHVAYAVAPAHAIAFAPDGSLVAVMETSGAVSVFEAEGGQKLAGLLSHSNESWAVVGPEGRYDASDPGNVGRLSWIVEDEPLFPVPVEAFIQEYYEPRLLARRIAGEELPPLAPPQDKTRVTPEVDSIDVEPPSQRGDADPSVTIRLAIAERQRNGVRSGLGAVKLFRDGQLVALAETAPLGPDGQAELRFEDIALPPGEGTVTFSAYAFNADGIKGGSAETQFELPSSVSTDTGKRAFVIAVGVNAYDNSAWNLSYAASDAEATAEILQAGLEASNAFDEIYSVGLLSRSSDKGEEARLARRDVIEAVIGQLSGRPLDPALPQELRDRLPVLPKARPQDLVYIAFAGHGLAGSDGRFHFFTQEFGAGSQGRQMSDDLLATTLDSDRLTALLQGIDAGDMVLVIDACNSAASVEGAGFKPGPMGSKGLGQIAYDKSMRVMAASQAEAVALESDKLRHGALTYALLREGLEAGQADRAPNDGSISFGELLSYSRDRVPDLYRSLRTGSFEPLSRGAFSLLEDEEKPVIPAQQPALFDFRRSNRADVALRAPD